MRPRSVLENHGVGGPGITLGPEEGPFQDTQSLEQGTKDSVLWEEGARLFVLNELDTWVAAQRMMSLPLAAGLYKAGVGVRVLVTYLTSLALLSIIRIPLEVGFLGWRLTLIRVAASALLPPLAGLAARGMMGGSGG